MIERNDPQWYKDAIIYQVHVKSFFDANDDGVGDFEGLTKRLDYIKDLGVTAIWLMPFYPSPLKDDGYDIAEYRDINPAYGTMRDFRRFVRAAHDRGLRVITELVINHTSDQHPWFQRARRARPGSAARDFYVWSDTDRKYVDTRIIFLDTEQSNWTWDPIAKSYFWHRFYSHQPDLNFDNPRVLEAVIDVMRFWLDMGVDGLRLDAIPYLIERDGTNCENLPETHTVIKKIRAALDESYPDRMLLAEANQWPEETAQYFGDGDECHMAFHFPLMPRMYMAIAQEDRHPVTDIMRQTPEIPENAQWAIFLRNHDELTLEMVTDQERDYLWSFYASERRARINLGIRRRLSPLLENDRRKIELMNSLLMSMPGTPVLYYGDEIGMGDNIYLGDRDGVRTPMQWSPDRNGGFSRADPARLFLPAVQDPLHGFQAVNVEAQLGTQASLLNWARRMIAVRRAHKVFGRGTLRFLYPSNRKVLAYLREFGDEKVLCVVNVSRAPQAVELDLAEFKGANPVEMGAGSVFPPVGDLPYLLTLPAYGYYWFELRPQAASAEGRFGPKPQPELFTLVLTGAADSLLAGRERAAFERTVAAGFLPSRRWFAGKGRRIDRVEVTDHALMEREGRSYLLPRLSVELKGGETQHYFTPLAVLEGREEEHLLGYAVAKVRRGARTGLVVDADAAPDFALAAVEAMQRGDSLKTHKGAEIRFTGTPALAEEQGLDQLEIRRLGAEQSNSSIAFDDKLLLKIYRRVQPGVHPEIEVARFLTEVAGFEATPPYLGSIEAVDPDGTSTSLGILQRFVRNQGDAWSWTLNALGREFENLALIAPDVADPVDETFAAYLPYARILGRRTAEMHLAFATETEDEAFAAEPLTMADVDHICDDARRLAERAFEGLGRTVAVSDASATAITALRERRDEVFALIDTLRREPALATKTRVHGDYHLGQVLIVRDDILIVDFEGEPSRPVHERRMKSSPLRDVAGMLRSFAYAVETSLRDIQGRLPDGAGRVETAAHDVLTLVERVFLAAYAEVAQGSRAWVGDDATRTALLRLQLLSKALYEVGYEADNRPEWIDIPVRGVLSILDGEVVR
ncbi:trehalose synthase [Alsobacter metallidurans]|uniref:Maltokinase n=1 Tax=Alsobacter metallidurans TaxID=340221 RepID=A0A917I4J5_9HYPH|nr:maltose alpha-D-glucosyltransferase [Alsobacter metallidurans]GGH09352.1 trehalose synthase [Alsobacter metallidurans]